MNNRIRTSLVAQALIAAPLLLGMAAPVQAQVIIHVIDRVLLPA